MSRLKREMARFLVAGFCAVGTDVGSYFLILKALPHDYSKGISFLLGTIVAYFINKNWTFEKKTKAYEEMGKFAILYLSTLGANVLVNRIVLNLFQSTFLAFLLATGVSTVLNFIGQKCWVFKRN
jgi:putative flippase GtrA